MRHNLIVTFVIFVVGISIGWIIIKNNIKDTIAVCMCVFSIICDMHTATGTEWIFTLREAVG